MSTMNQKTIRIKKTAFFIRLYEFVWSKDAPNGLCPLVWQTIVALILFIPLIILNLPVILITTFRVINCKKPLDEFMWEWKYGTTFSEKIAISIFSWAGIWICYTFIAGWYYIIIGKIAEHSDIATLALLFTAVGVIVCSLIFYKRIKKAIKNFLFPIKTRLRYCKNRILFLRFVELHPDILEGRSFSSEEEKENYLWGKFCEYREKHKSENTATPWHVLLWEGIKAFYNRNCPRIEWI